MKKCLFVLAFITIVWNNYSQKTLSNDYAYTVSEPYKVFDAKEKKYFSKGNEVMALKFDGKEVLIQKFSTEKPSLIKEKLYENYFPKHYQVEDVIQVDTKYYFFYSSWDGDNDKEQLFSIEIDFEKGELIGSPKLLIQVNGKVARSPLNTYSSTGGSHDFLSFGMVGLGYESKFDFIQSSNKKSILVQYRKKPLIKSDVKSTDIIGLFTYNENLEKISGNEVTMPYTERRMNNLDYQLDNEGNLYLLAKVFHDDSNRDKKSKKDSELNYHLELLMMKSASNEVKISKIESKDKFINKLWLFDTKNDYVLCAGFYSNNSQTKNWLDSQSHFDDSDGIALFKIKRDGMIYDQVFHEIPLEVINQYESERTTKRNERRERKGENAQFNDLEFKDVKVNEDGSVVLIGEQYFTIYHQNYNGTPGIPVSNSGYYTFHYCDMLVSKINADGSLGWMKKIVKNQVGKRGKGGMSYKYFDANNSHYFVFLDNVKNIDLAIDQTPKKHSDGQGGYLTAVKLDDVTGEVNKGSILNAREVEDFQIYQFATSRIVQTSADTFMLEVYKKKKEDVMIKVTLK